MTDSTFGIDTDELQRHLRRAIPDVVVDVRASSGDPSRPEVRFTSRTFVGLYPRQRYHRVIHALPPGYHERHLASAVWYELAPGETEARYHEQDVSDDLVDGVEQLVVAVLTRADFPGVVAELLSARGCDGTFAASKLALARLGHRGAAVDDACHVLMRRGAFCDCEVPNAFQDGAGGA